MTSSPKVRAKRCAGALVIAMAVGVLSPPAALTQDQSPSQTAISVELARLLGDDPEEHQLALSRIIELGEGAMGEDAVEELEAVVTDPSNPARVRSGAVFALGRIRAERSRAVLEAQWEAGLEALGGAVAIQVAIALAEFGNFEPLRAIVVSQDEILGAKAAVQLGLRGDAESLSLLQQGYESEAYSRMRPFFAVALGLLGDARGEEVLRSGLLAVELRNHCAVALSRCGQAEGVRFELEFALEDPDPLVRLAALDALVTLEPSNLDELLVALSNDVDSRVRDRVEEAERHRQRRRPSP